MVTIGLPVYNEERFVSRAIESLLGQTFRDFVLAVCDNASTDRTVEICQGYTARDPRVVVHRAERTMPAAANFQRAVGLAATPFFMWAAADDQWAPGFIAVLLRDLQSHPAAAVAMAAVRRVDEEGRTLDVVDFRGRNDPAHRGPHGMVKGVTSNRKYNLFLYGLHRTDVLRRAAPLFPDILGGDRIFLVQFALGTPLRYVDEVLHIKTRRASHETNYRAASGRKGIQRRQIRAVAAVVARSAIVPFHRKAILGPIAVARYALWTLAYAHGTAILGRALSWYLDSDGLVAVLRRGGPFKRARDRRAGERPD